MDLKIDLAKYTINSICSNDLTYNLSFRHEINGIGS